MVSVEYRLEGALGIHARVAVRIATYARDNLERSLIWIEQPNGEKVDTTSVLSLMGMPVHVGDVISIHFDGADEVKVCDELCELLHEERI